MWWTLFYLLISIIAGIYYFSKRKFDYWKKRKVPHLEPTPIFGNYGDFILQKRHLMYVIQDLCKKFPDEPYFGAFMGTEPALIVQDPDLLKLITTKDFYYFNGRETSDHVHKESLTRNIFANNGDEWRVVRQNLTPVFTSSKMKNMFHLIANCAHEFENVLNTEMQKTDVIDARLYMIRFTMACIVSCAFGLESETLKEGYEDNQFTKIGNSFFSTSKTLAAKFTAKSIWPNIFYGLGFKVSPDGTDEFFKNLLLAVFEARNYKPTPRNDFVDFLMNFKVNSHMVGDSITNLKTGENKKVQLPVTEELLYSQSVIFFLAGFETSATTTGYTLYNLAKNPESQKKVHEEIDGYLRKYDNKLTYDIVTELPYTYACVEESLRLFPVLPVLTREVMEAYTLPSGVQLDRGTRIHIPVQMMHHNAKYFPEPEAYRPERFLGDERKNIKPCSYMPFGEGARLCIGMRFAKMQVLAGLVTFLKKYKMELQDGMADHIEFEAQPVIPSPKNGLYLKVIPRDGWETRAFAKA